MEEFKVDILKADVPTRNGNCYSSEALQKAIDEWKAKNQPLPGIIGCSIGCTIDQKDVAFTVSDLKLEGGNMIGTIKVADTHQGHILETLINGHVPVSYRSYSTGNVHMRDNGTKEITDINLLGVNVIPEDDAE
jgi:hypothetical protein